jgi:monothiol glutaredoxin
LTEIAHEVRQHKVILYMKGTPAQPMCGFSARAAAILGSFGVPFHTINILADPEKRQGIKEAIPEVRDFEWGTIPQIFVDGAFLGGSDLLQEMYESGQLDDVLKEAFSA